MYGNAIVHRNDPRSSYEAAERVIVSGQRETHAERIFAALAQRGGQTAAELAQRVGMDAVEVRRRLVDLRAAGKAFQGDDRRCEVAGTLAVEWFAAREGDGEQGVFGL